MWLNAFSKDQKVLSPIELLVLGTVRKENLSAKQISDRLLDSTSEWQPASGTVYPILHRLTERGFLHRSKGNRINFRRTHMGNIFLASILKPLKVQIEESNRFYLAILNSLLKVQPAPIGLHQFMDEIEETTNQYLQSIQEIKSQASNVSDDSFDVPIDFE
ncbi:MAG: PadR family transcriptional regulator [Candidatus Heimdallarchaeota archaeon]|nr:PadR family transcriptional regulator [Candidatus Heimdallarchaeota archaeon]